MFFYSFTSFCATYVISITLMCAIALFQALWQLLWLNPPMPASSGKSATGTNSLRSRPVEFIQHRVSIAASELLSQVHKLIIYIVTCYRCKMI